MITRINKIVSEIQEINGDEYLKLIFEHQEYLYFKFEKRFFCVKNSDTKIIFDDLCYKMWQDLDATVIENIYDGYFRKIIWNY